MEFFQANIQLGEVLVQLAAFVVVFWTLKLFAWKKILSALDARRDAIQNQFNQIESARKEVEALKQNYTHAISHIEEETRAKLQQAIDEGKRVARELQEHARKEGRAIVDKAKEDIQLEVAKARVTLRNEIADLTLAATERLLEEKLDEKKDKEIVLNFIEQLEKMP